MNAEDALFNLFVKRNPGYLGPVESFEEGFAEHLAGEIERDHAAGDAGVFDVEFDSAGSPAGWHEILLELLDRPAAVTAERVVGSSSTRTGVFGPCSASSLARVIFRFRCTGAPFAMAM